MRKLHVYLAGVCTILALAGCSPQTQQFTGGDPKLLTQAGVKEGGGIKANGQPGFLVYGPYIALEPGVYRLLTKGNLAGPNQSLGTIDVAANTGKLILAAKPIVADQGATGSIVSLDFEIAKPIADAEFRINVAAQTTGSFTAYELTKIAK
jgi:hypothetical protein